MSAKRQRVGDPASGSPPSPSPPATPPTAPSAPPLPASPSAAPAAPPASASPPTVPSSSAPAPAAATTTPAAAGTAAAATPSTGAPAGADGSGSAAAGTLYVSRDERAQREEESGVLSFRVIHNDGNPKHMRWLITLKNIFAQQLPKMPREYIVRLVMDHRHRSLVIVKGDKEFVAGGVCYRPFLEQRFAEIAFMAITSSEQVRGYGTRLMNNLKQTVKADGIDHFLTYADNYAVGYFRKQGFVKGVSMEPSRWKNYIKSYDGGTLMECTVHPDVDYLHLPAMVKRQRAALLARHNAQSQEHVVYPGLSFDDGPIRSVYDILGVVAAGWTPPDDSSRRQAMRDTQSLQTQLTQLLNNIAAHSEAWPFVEPVDLKEYPDYTDTVKDPIDLSAMKTKLQAGFYTTVSMFTADTRRIFANARAYNAPDSAVVACANKLESYVTTCIRKLALK